MKLFRERYFNSALFYCLLFSDDWLPPLPCCRPERWQTITGIFPPVPPAPRCLARRRSRAVRACPPSSLPATSCPTWWQPEPEPEVEEVVRPGPGFPLTTRPGLVLALAPATAQPTATPTCTATDIRPTRTRPTGTEAIPPSQWRRRPRRPRPPHPSPPLFTPGWEKQSPAGPLTSQHPPALPRHPAPQTSRTHKQVR